MAKVALTNLVNLQNETTAVTAINNNNAATTTAMNNTLSRDGTSPNQMGATLDMNSNRIINLPTATATTEPITLAQMNSILASGQVPNGLVTSGVTALQLGIAAEFIPQNYGAVGDGVHDDTSALQACINAAQAAGHGVVHILSGNYKITSALNITSPITIYGNGGQASVLKPQGNINCLNINMFDAIACYKFGIIWNTPPASGAGIFLTWTGAGQNLGSVFRDLYISQAYNGFAQGAAANWTFDNCQVSNSVNAGVVVRNTFHADNGDSVIMNCIITTNAGGGIGIQFLSSGGLRIISNKISGNMVYGILSQIEGTTAILLIQGNSIEGCISGCIYLTRTAGSGFSQCIIIGNEFANSNVLVGVPLDAVGVWLSNLVICNNTGGGNLAGSNTYVTVSSTLGVCIANNVFNSGIGTNIAFVLGASTDKVVLGPNVRLGTFASNSVNSTNTTQISPT